MTGETMLCHWHEYEAYTMLTPPKRAPFSHSWALRAQERPSVKRQGDQEHAYIVVVEKADDIRKWVFAIWAARVCHPPLAPHPLFLCV
jgi:hypothetical protein